MKKLIITLIIVILALPLNLQAAESQVTLTWDANSTAHFGYQLFCREAGQSYDYSDPSWFTNDPSITQGTVTDCLDGRIDDTLVYYLVVRAVDGQNNQSADSNEVRFPIVGDSGDPGDNDTGDSNSDRSVGGSGGGDGLSSSCFIQSLLSR